jgi:hypothetical protein
MLSIRIVTCVGFLIVSLGGAAAQTATEGAPSKPIQLLKIIEQPNNAKTKPHAKLPAKSFAKTAGTKAVKARNAVAESSQAQTAPAPAMISPTDAPTESVAAELASPPATASSHPEPSERVVESQTAQGASANHVNENDLAANVAATLLAGSGSPRITAATFDAAAPQATGTPIGSASWIAQVLAALGGAIAAGSVAWFLIGYAPARTYAEFDEVTPEHQPE